MTRRFVHCSYLALCFLLVFLHKGRLILHQHRAYDRRFMAVRNFRPHETTTPDGKLLLPLKKGEVMLVSGNARHGYFSAALNGSHGLVPESHVVELDGRSADCQSFPTTLMVSSTVGGHTRGWRDPATVSGRNPVR
jgi:hypothetical protein